MLNKRCQVRGFVTLNQLEKVYLITKEPLTLAEKNRLHYQGNNRGNTIGPVKMHAFNDPDTWQLTKKQKLELFGSKGKLLVGGSSPASAAADEADAPEPAKKQVRKSTNTVEPVFYHQWPRMLFEEFIYSFDLHGVIQLCAGSTDLAFASLTQRKPFWGIVMNETHKKLFLARLEKITWAAMQDEKYPAIYEAGLVELMKDGKATVDDSTQPEVTPKPLKKKKADPSPTVGSGEGGPDSTRSSSSTTLKKCASVKNKQDILAKIAALNDDKPGKKGQGSDAEEEEDDDSKST